MNFENIGKVYLNTTSWKLFTYIDFNQHLHETMQLNDNLKVLEDYCNKSRKRFPLDHCRITLRIINASLAEINYNNVQFSQIFHRHQTTRSRRGVIDGIGTAGKFLFGLMDADDAEHYNQAIETLQNNDAKLIHLMEKQASVINNVITSLNNTEIALNKTLTKVSVEIQNLYKKIDDNAEFEINLHIFDELANIMTHLVTKSLSYQENLFDILQEAKLGHINKHLTNNERYLQALKEIQLELHGEFRLVAKPTWSNLAMINQVSQIIPIYIKNDLVFQINIPLTSDEYKLYYLNSIPCHYENNLYYYIRSDSPYMAINEAKMQYMFLKNHEFQKCSKLPSKTFLCHGNFLSYIQDKSNCIIGLSLGDFKPANCDVRIMALEREIWLSLSDANTWAYATPVAIPLRISCNETTYTIPISKSGILELESKCSARTDHIILQTKTEIPNAKSEFVIIPKTFNEELSIIRNYNFSHFKGRGHHTKFTLEAGDLDSVSIALQDLKHEIDNHNIASVSKVHATLNYGLTSLLVVFVMIGLIICIIKRFFKCRISKNCSDTTEQNTN